MAHNLFLDNAYLILGLDVDATEKEIVRRGRELDKILEIGEVPSYEQDFEFSVKRRTKKNVEEAIKRLLDVKNEVMDTFFWFDLHSTVDRVAVRHCRRGEWREGIEIWEEKIKENSNSPNCFTMIRNKATAESILYYDTRAKKWLKAALKDWCYLIESDKQWEIFSKVFRLKNPSMDNKVLEKFRDNAKDCLAEYFFRIINELEDNEDNFAILGEILGSYGSSYEKEIIGPKVDRIRELISEADSWRKEIKDGGGLDSNYYSRIDNLRKAIDNAAGELQALGDDVWERGDIKNLRNDCANDINYLCNAICGRDEIQEYPTRIDAALKLLRLGYNIAPSDSAIERQIMENRDAIQSVRFFAKNKATYDAILANVRIGDWYSARNYINELLGDPEIDDKSREELETMIRRLGFTPQPTYRAPAKNTSSSQGSASSAELNNSSSSSGNIGDVIGNLIAIVFITLMVMVIMGSLIGSCAG